MPTACHHPCFLMDARPAGVKAYSGVAGIRGQGGAATGWNGRSGGRGWGGRGRPGGGFRPAVGARVGGRVTKLRACPGCQNDSVAACSACAAAGSGLASILGFAGINPLAAATKKGKQTVSVAAWLAAQQLGAEVGQKDLAACSAAFIMPPF